MELWGTKERNPFEATIAPPLINLTKETVVSKRSKDKKNKRKERYHS